MVKNRIITLGVDQGIANMGYAVLSVGEDNKTVPDVLVSGVITTEATQSMQQRMLILYDELEKIVNAHPDISMIGTESLFVNGFKAGGRNKSAAIVATNMVTGVIYLLAARKNLILKQYTPGSVKKYIAGVGDASKLSVEEALSHVITHNCVDIQANHQSDAIAIAWTSAMDIMTHGLTQVAESEAKQKKIKRSKKPRVMKTKEFMFHCIELEKSTTKPQHAPYYIEKLSEETLSQMKSESIAGRFRNHRLLMYTGQGEETVQLGFEVGKKSKCQSRVVPETHWYYCEYKDVEPKNIHRCYGNLVRKLEKHPKYQAVPNGKVIEVTTDDIKDTIDILIGIEIENPIGA